VCVCVCVAVVLHYFLRDVIHLLDVRYLTIKLTCALKLCSSRMNWCKGNVVCKACTIILQRRFDQYDIEMEFHEGTQTGYAAVKYVHLHGPPCRTGAHHCHFNLVPQPKVKKRLRMSENRVLRRIYGTNREEWQRVGENYTLKSFIIRTFTKCYQVIKSMKMRWAENVARMRDDKYVHKKF
jgi:hypothetical protein